MQHVMWSVVSGRSGQGCSQSHTERSRCAAKHLIVSFRFYFHQVSCWPVCFLWRAWLKTHTFQVCQALPPPVVFNPAESASDWRLHCSRTCLVSWARSAHVEVLSFLLQIKLCPLPILHKLLQLFIQLLAMSYAILCAILCNIVQCWW